MGASEVDHAAAARQPLDRLAVAILGIASRAQQRARARLDAECPVRAGRLGSLTQAFEGGGGRVRGAAADAGLDQLDEGPSEGADIVVLTGSLGGRQRLGV